MEKNQGSESHTLRERGGQSRSMKRKGKERGLSGKSRRKHEGVSGRRNSPGESRDYWFHSKSGHT